MTVNFNALGIICLLVDCKFVFVELLVLNQILSLGDLGHQVQGLVVLSVLYFKLLLNVLLLQSLRHGVANSLHL